MAAAPTEEQLRGLAEATGAGEDECLAALLECGGVAEEAASRLLERPASGAGASSSSAASGSGAASSSRPAGPWEEQGARLAELTGCPLEVCLVALQAEAGNPDAATARLLQLDDFEGDAGLGSAGEGDAGAEEVPATGAGGGAEEESEDTELDEGEAMMAKQVAEVAGQPFHAGLRALRDCGGRADDAVAALLGLAAQGAESPAEADEAQAEEAEAEEASETPPPAGIAETMASSPFRPAEDPFAGVEATDVDGDELLRLAGSDPACAPPAKRRRAEGDRTGE